MGPTGSGKSIVSNQNFLAVLFLSGEQFITAAMGVDTSAGHDLEPCTTEISMIKMTFLNHNIVFVDTPGFDVEISDSDILKMISDELERAYVVLECTKDAVDHLTDIGRRGGYCLAAFSISIGYQTFA